VCVCVCVWWVCVCGVCVCVCVWCGVCGVCVCVVCVVCVCVCACVCLVTKLNTQRLTTTYSFTKCSIRPPNKRFFLIIFCSMHLTPTPNAIQSLTLNNNKPAHYYPGKCMLKLNSLYELAFIWISSFVLHSFSHKTLSPEIVNKVTDYGMNILKYRWIQIIVAGISLHLLLIHLQVYAEFCWVNPKARKSSSHIKHDHIPTELTFLFLHSVFKNKYSNIPYDFARE